MLSPTFSSVNLFFESVSKKSKIALIINTRPAKRHVNGTIMNMGSLRFIVTTTLHVQKVEKINITMPQTKKVIFKTSKIILFTSSLL